MSGDGTGAFDGLPEILHEIAQVAGLEAALKIHDQYGGTIVYIPRRAPARHWLVECVGRAAANAICDHYRILDAEGHASGLRIQIPLGGASIMAQTKRKLVRILEKGDVSPPRAARMCGLHERTAWRVAAKLQRSGDDLQGDLFQD